MPLVLLDVVGYVSAFQRENFRTVACQSKFKRSFLHRTATAENKRKIAAMNSSTILALIDPKFPQWELSPQVDKYCATRALLLITT